MTLVCDVRMEGRSKCVPILSGDHAAGHAFKMVVQAHVRPLLYVDASAACAHRLCIAALSSVQVKASSGILLGHGCFAPVQEDNAS